MVSVAALINAMGKLPIVGLEQGLSVMNLIAISFWSRVARFLCSKSNVSASNIDKMIGFSPGPFQMIDQVILHMFSIILLLYCIDRLGCLMSLD